VRVVVTGAGGARPGTAVDAVVIGAGPNGLVAANLLADAGWDVLVLEATDRPGGAVRSAEITAPGFVSDLCSAFYPLGAASPVLRRLGLERYGLTWRHAPEVLAHLLPDGRCAVLSRDLDTTAASVDAFAAGDGDAWRAEAATWRRGARRARRQRRPRRAGPQRAGRRRVRRRGARRPAPRLRRPRLRGAGNWLGSPGWGSGRHRRDAVVAGAGRQPVDPARPAPPPAVPILWPATRNPPDPSSG
jgi:phytoene dehydrogenase-like protein